MSSTGETFLRRFHDARPGVTARAFGELAMTVAGRHYGSSYELLADIVPRGAQAMRVVDIGYGDGHLLSCLACRQQAGLQLIGIDFSRGELAQGAWKLGERAALACSRAQALPLSAASVDYVLSHMALMLMDEPANVLAELRRVLVPGGGFAAIVGARTPDCQMTEIFLEVLRSFALAPAWRQLRLGDCRWRDDDSVRDLFADFDEVRVVAVVVERRVTPAVAWDWLAETYDPALLVDADRVELRSQFLAACRARVDGDGGFEQRIGLRLITARAPAMRG